MNAQVDYFLMIIVLIASTTVLTVVSTYKAAVGVIVNPETGESDLTSVMGLSLFTSCAAASGCLERSDNSTLERRSDSRLARGRAYPAPMADPPNHR